MKTLSADDIESLLGIRASDIHPLDILGYGYTSEGAERFRADHPHFLPQISRYVHGLLRTASIFPPGTDPGSAGFQTFIHRAGDSFTVSSVEEVGFGKLERITGSPMSEESAIREYIGRVVNPDYVF